MPSAPASTAHPTVLVAVLSAAGISVSLMQTLIVPLIPELPNLLHTSASNASWAITATLLAAAVATPVFGRLGDMYGPKPMLIACAVILIAGSLLAATTSSLLPLIIGRALQGFGIPIIPLGISVLRSSVPPERVGGAMGLMSASLGVGGALGLPLSAVIVQHYDWRVLFWFATALGVAALVMFAALVPHVPPRTSDRLDPLGAVLLAGGLVTLLLGISKGRSWGWTSGLTLSMFGSAVVIFAVFGWWQLRVSSPTVDLRTTAKRPVLTTNIASVAIAFGMFALSYVAPQILELPPETGYGLGQSLLWTGLWLAPGGLAMMVTSPLAARVSAVRGPRFTLVTGALIISASYGAGLFLLAAPWQIMVLNVLVAVGVGFGYASMPALINAAVPMSETAAANGINALARSLGTSISSAVIGAILAGMTMSFAGHDVPTLAGLRSALVVAAGAAALAAVLAMLIPVAKREQAAVVVAPVPVEVDDVRVANTMAIVPENEETTEMPSPPRSPDGAISLVPRAVPRPYVVSQRRASAPELTPNLLLSQLDQAGELSLRELADAFGTDMESVSPHVGSLLRDGLATGAGRTAGGRSPLFCLTPLGLGRLHG
jgi:MFS family permease